MTLPIYVYGSEVLREVAEEVDVDKTDKEELRRYIDDMFETMYHADGVGLAAPQVGDSRRILVVDGRDVADVYPELKDFRRAMVNPVVIEESEETAEYSEGCLSVPDIHCNVVRPKKITVRYLDADLKETEEELDGFACRMVQHEMDHLDGHLFVDKVAPIRRKMIAAKLHNIAKGKVRTAYKTRLEK